MTAVVFDPEEFREAKPQFAAWSDQRLNFLFEEATLFVDNSDLSIVPYDPPRRVHRKTILFLVVCHLATLDEWAEDGRAGAVASATEGSVSVSYAQKTGDSSWWSQTPCGDSAWALLRRYAQGGYWIRGRRDER
jgi:hypothetical protein